MASLKGYTDIVRLLLERGSEPDLKCRDGADALFIASLNGHADVVKLLAGKRGFTEKQ